MLALNMEPTWIGGSSAEQSCSCCKARGMTSFWHSRMVMTSASASQTRYAAPHVANAAPVPDKKRKERDCVTLAQLIY